MPKVTAANPYQGAAAALAETAHALDQAARELVNEDAAASLKKAGRNASEAAAHIRGAIVDSGDAVGHLIAGTVSVVEALGEAARAAAIGTVATAGWVAEKIGAAARLAFLNLSKFFASAANLLAKAIGDPQRVKLSVEVLGDPGAKSFSERMFDKAGDSIKLSGAALSYAWDEYADAARAAASSVTNAGFAALHSGAVLANLGAAAIQSGAAGVAKLAELGVRAARVGVLAAEKGVEGAREGALLAAELSARAANALARPDQDKYAISVADIKAFEARVVALEQAAA